MDALESIRFGLFLESDNVWLKWNSTFEELANIASPEITKWGGPFKELKWKEKAIFQGLIFDVTAVFELDKNGNPFGGLKFIRFFSSKDSDAHTLAFTTRDHLIKLIGLNTIDKSFGDEYYWAWEINGIRLIVGIEERYSTVFHFHFELID